MGHSTAQIPHRMQLTASTSARFWKLIAP